MAESAKRPKSRATRGLKVLFMLVLILASIPSGSLAASAGIEAIDQGSDILLIVSLTTAAILLILLLISLAIIGRLKSKLSDSKNEREEDTDLRIDEFRHLLVDILDSMPSVIIGVEKEMKITQWNLGAEEFSGIRPEVAIGGNLFEIFPDINITIQEIDASIENAELVLRDKVFYKTERVEGYFDQTIFPILSKEFSGAVIRIDDVTQRAKLEEMMIQTEKMISVGSLAAGMAHEINNPLAGILQNVQVVKNRLFADLQANKRVAAEIGLTQSDIIKYLELRGVDELLEHIYSSGERATAIVKNMLSFSRQSNSKQIEYNLETIIEETLLLARNEFNLRKNYDFCHIDVVKEFEPNLPLVQCESNKIQQVFLNILQNAAHAISQELTGRQPVIMIRMKLEGKYLTIEFEDNGVGMDESVRKRIFEPFYSTKEVGEGTGLGLSVSYFIVKENHGGILEVESEKTKGSKFIVKLPIKRCVDE